MQKDSLKSRARRASPNESGFSIIELMIAMVTFLIVTGSIYGLLEVARSDRSTTNQRVEIMQSARNALNAVGRDALNAGYQYPLEGASLPDGEITEFVGGSNDAGEEYDVLTAIHARNNVNPNSLIRADGIIENTDQLTFVFHDPSFNDDAPLGLSGRNADGTQVTISPGNNTNVTVQSSVPSVYMISGPPDYTGSSVRDAVAIATGKPDTVNVDFANPDAMDLNKSGTNATTTKKNSPVGDIASPRTLSRLTVVTYRVLNDGTMVRREYGVDAANSNVSGDDGKRDVPLAYGVENMQVQYVLDDGTKVDTPADMKKVRQVVVKLNLQSPEVDRRNNQRFRMELSTTINTRNLGYNTK